MMNIINGGAHSDSPIDFQEFMIMPKGLPLSGNPCATGRKFSMRSRMCCMTAAFPLPWGMKGIRPGPEISR